MKIESSGDKFVITDFNDIEAYKLACKIEKDGIYFYKKLKENSDDKGIKEMFDFLIAEENKHLKFFEDCLYELRESEEDRDEDNDLLEGFNYGIFDFAKDIKELEKIVNTPKKALKLGELAEQRSIKFYRACQDQVSGRRVKDELENIIGEEIKHQNHFRKALTGS
ncbi:MAG: ferritin family protein [Candidatus Omnitrophica bacterium]|nr:ferritin family protein [Candidatus Omnitrophota bacterium]MCF7892532.1 ferritin family protein [Candidatus Omnitrophota bacterium]MCF7897254.1 ferritin family protein [Candidatus Omnitrophota bacterium]MCF7909289.1 ferritin family protein [Candidatus Omnitrophota bacterium]